MFYKINDNNIQHVNSLCTLKLTTQFRSFLISRKDDDESIAKTLNLLDDFLNAVYYLQQGSSEFFATSGNKRENPRDFLINNAEALRSTIVGLRTLDPPLKELPILRQAVQALFLCYEHDPDPKGSESSSTELTRDQKRQPAAQMVPMAISFLPSDLTLETTAALPLPKDNKAQREGLRYPTGMLLDKEKKTIVLTFKSQGEAEAAEDFLQMASQLNKDPIGWDKGQVKKEEIKTAATSNSKQLVIPQSAFKEELNNFFAGFKYPNGEFARNVQSVVSQVLEADESARFEVDFSSIIPSSTKLPPTAGSSSTVTQSSSPSSSSSTISSNSSTSSSSSHFKVQNRLSPAEAKSQTPSWPSVAHFNDKEARFVFTNPAEAKAALAFLIRKTKYQVLAKRGGSINSGEDERGKLSDPKLKEWHEKVNPHYYNDFIKVEGNAVVVKREAWPEWVNYLEEFLYGDKENYRQIIMNAMVLAARLMKPRASALLSSAKEWSGLGQTIPRKCQELYNTLSKGKEPTFDPTAKPWSREYLQTLSHDDMYKEKSLSRMSFSFGGSSPPSTTSSSSSPTLSEPTVTGETTGISLTRSQGGEGS